MQITQVIVENTNKVGRTFQHVEDLVLIYGLAGAKNAIARLYDTARAPQTVRWKWDGKPTVYWGREPDGTFVMTGSGGWNRKDGTGKVTNAADFAKYLVSTGQNQDPTNRQAFARDFAGLWHIFEMATPKDFRGYVYADLLYAHRPQNVNGVFSFTPNQVTYTVNAGSNLGQRIARSMAAAVGHAYFPQFGMNSDAQQPINDFAPFNQTASLILLGPHYPQVSPNVDTGKLQQLTKYVELNGAAIDNLLNDEKLMAARMASFKQVLYKYVNTMNREGKLNNLSRNFFEWLPRSGQTQVMQDKIKNWIASNKQGFDAAFLIVESLRAVKNNIIDQLDKENTDIKQSMNGNIGGEGYVMYSPAGNVKLVRRERWKPPIT